jgi:hypothetical protein
MTKGDTMAHQRLPPSRVLPTFISSIFPDARIGVYGFVLTQGKNFIHDDVMKAYVEANFAKRSCRACLQFPQGPQGQRAASADHLFDPGTRVVMMQEGRQMQEHLEDFIDL